MKAYKLMRKRKDGTLGSLFINRKMKVPLQTWLIARAYRTNGYAFRPGWHCLFQPVAPHLKQGDNRTWVEVEIKDYEVFERPESQGGKWLLAQKMRVVREVLDEQN